MRRSIITALIALWPLFTHGQSVSIGSPQTGHLQNGKTLPVEGHGWSILPKTVHRDYRYGVDSLVGLIRDLASFSMQTYTVPVQVGNLSRKGGGDIPQSRSHNSGRDVDFAFPIRDRKSRRILRQNEYLTCTRDLKTRDGQGELDPAVLSGWIQYLLEYPGIEVGWIFVSRPIRDAILLELKSAPPKLQLRASSVLRQPSDSALHDDHIHLRIFCPKSDKPLCEDAQPQWPWMNPDAPFEGETETVKDQETWKAQARDLARQPGEWSEEDQESWFRATNQLLLSREDASNWLALHGSKPRREWLDLGYKTIGCARCISPHLHLRVAALIAALSKHPRYAFRIQRDLSALTGLPMVRRSAQEGHRKWKKWWKSNQSRYGIR